MFVLVIVLLLLGPSVVRAQDSTAGSVFAGYTRLYAGDADDAHRYFAELRSQDSNSLPAWFGQLFAQAVRLEVDESLAPAFERDVDAFIHRAEERYGRSRSDAEALFYLAQAHLLRSTYRIAYDKGVWGAARDAAKSKGYADDYIKQYPAHGDAYLTLGLYNYYVDIAPTFVKVLRVLLLLPSGNRAEGMKQLERAAREGSLFAPLAEGALANIYGSLEGRLAEAIPVAERFVQRFPGNAAIRIALAQLYAHPTVEAYERAADQYSAVIGTATSSSLRHIADRHRAILGMAGLRRSQWRIADAIALLTPVIDQPIAKPAWIAPTFLLQRANYRMLLNDPNAADDARRVSQDPAMAASHKEARRQRGAIDEWRQSGDAALYAALIPGNRLVVEDRFDEARSLYERVGASSPGSSQVRYRLATVDFARRDYPAAAKGFAEIASSSARMPDWLKANAMLHLAWTHDLAGRRQDAVTLYKRIIDDYENESPSGPARLGLIAAYRGPVTIR